MKKILLLILLVTIGVSTYSQTTPNWSWLYGASNAGGKSITTSTNGDTYVLGSFYSTAKFGSSILTSIGDRDVFLAKFGVAGNLIWLKQIGSAQIEDANTVKVKGNNVYIYGQFQGSVTLGTNTLTSNGGTDVFVAKLDTSGNYIWAKSGGSAGKEFCYLQGMVIDKDENVYITGDLQSTQSATFGSVVLTGSPNGGIFLIKYNSSGSVEWGKSGSSSNNSSALAITTDNTGNICLTGAYIGTLTFGSTILTSINTVGGDAFLMKFNPLGNVTWAKTISGTDKATSTAVSSDKDNNIFIAGESNGNLALGSLTSPAGTGGMNTELFIAKYDSNGNATWVKRAGSHSTSTSNFISNDLVNDNAGNVYWTGNYFDTLDFYSGGVKAVTLNANSVNVFVVKYDGNGNAKWVLDGGGKADDLPSGMFLDNSSNIYVTGSFSFYDSVTKFGTYSFNADSKNNQQNLFIAKFSTTTGINETTSNNIPSIVYPNPVNDNLIVTGNIKGAIINVVDVVGRKVISVIAESDKEIINTSSLSNGSYFIEIITDSKFSCHKINKL